MEENSNSISNSISNTNSISISNTNTNTNSISNEISTTELGPYSFKGDEFDYLARSDRFDVLLRSQEPKRVIYGKKTEPKVEVSHAKISSPFHHWSFLYLILYYDKPQSTILPIDGTWKELMRLAQITGIQSDPYVVDDSYVAASKYMNRRLIVVVLHEEIQVYGSEELEDAALVIKGVSKLKRIVKDDYVGLDSVGTGPFGVLYEIAKKELMKL